MFFKNFLTELQSSKLRRRLSQIFVAFPENLIYILRTVMGVRVREREGEKNEKCIEVWTSSRITEKLADDINKVKFHMI